MSKSLAWALPPREIKWNYPDINKYVIGEYFEEGYGGGGLDVEVGSVFIPFLKGLKAGIGSELGSKDIQRMIEAIEKHGKILISIH